MALSLTAVQGVSAYAAHTSDPCAQSQFTIVRNPISLLRENEYRARRLCPLTIF
jgi:hypothetical protein